MFNILVYGLSVAVCGMLTVFAALVILIGLVKALEKCVNGEALAFFQEKVGAKVQARFRGEVKAPASVAADVPAQNNDELVAVITAAVAAMLEAEAAAGGAEAAVEEAPKGFVVRSIRRISNAPAWNRAGREEQVYSRM